MTVHAYSVQDAYIYGFALQETDMASETPDDFAAEAQRQMDAYEEVLADYPNLVEVVGGYVAKAGYDYAAEFLFGLDLILDGLDRLRDDVKEIVTERLVLRLLPREDVPAFAAYRSDPEVARYQSWDTSYSAEDGERLVAAQQGVEFGDPGPWVQVAAIDRVTGELCGDCAVRVATDQPQTAEVGVTFAPAQPGQRPGDGGARRRGHAIVRGARHPPRLRTRPTTATSPSTACSNGLGFRCEARLVEADWFKGVTRKPRWSGAFGRRRRRCHRHRRRIAGAGFEPATFGL